MTTALSMMCLRGPHWACVVCAPQRKCTEHNARCILTHSLWYTTISNLTPMAAVCPNGCVGSCKCSNSGPFEVSLGSLGTFTDSKTKLAMLRRAGAVRTACGLYVKRGTRPFTLDVLSETRHLTRNICLRIDVQLPAGFGHAINLGTRAIPARSKATRLSCVPTSVLPKSTVATFSKLWATVVLSNAKVVPTQAAERHASACVANRRSKSVAVPTKPGVRWLNMGASRAKTVLPPGYRRQNCLVQCVWCNALYSSLNKYRTHCAPDAERCLPKE